MNFTSYSDFVKAVAKAQRAKQIVRGASIAPEMKARLEAEIDATIASYSFKTTPEPAKGK